MLQVKGVPVFYLPVLYYPTKRGRPRDRLPDADLRLVDAPRPVAHNAFFWAINRSQDATFCTTGSRRPARASAASTATTSARGDGNLRAYCSTRTRPRTTLDGGTTATPARAATRSAAAPTRCCPAACARAANVNYFSSIATSQTFNTNIYDASRNQRIFGGNVVGAWGSYSLNGTFDHSEYFYNHDRLGVVGQLAARRVHAQRAADRSDSPVYFSRRHASSRTSLRSTRTTGDVEHRHRA